MTGATKKELIVGVVFVAILVIIGVFTILIRGINPLKPPQDLVVYFKDGVGGLREGNVVRIAGLEVGQVDDMELMPIGVLVHLSVKNNVKLFPGYEITVRAFSPLGGKYVDVRRGRQTMEPLTLTLTGGDFRSMADDETVNPATALHLEGAINNQNPVRGTAEAELIKELATLAENIRPDIEAAIRNIRETTEKVNSMQGTVGKLVGDPALFDSLRGAAENIEEATGHLVGIAEKADSGTGTIAKLLNDSKLYDEAANALESVGNVAAKVDEGKGTVGRLFNNDSLALSLEKSVENLNRILEKANDENGQGTISKIVNDGRLYEELVESLESIQSTLALVNEGKGPVGVLLKDEESGERVKRTLASVERATERLDRTMANVEITTGAIADGKGTIGRLIMDDRLVNEAERVIVELRESVEDIREQAPVSAFVQAVFAAF
ncbi:MAG: MlaD family protein [Planctomycetota bacterium]|jgi:phospholipid/cholesterol/gamma-HCH transport system substrate-binding protein